MHQGDGGGSEPAANTSSPPPRRGTVRSRDAAFSRPTPASDRKSSSRPRVLQVAMEEDDEVAAPAGPVLRPPGRPKRRASAGFRDVMDAVLRPSGPQRQRPAPREQTRSARADGAQTARSGGDVGPLVVRARPQRRAGAGACAAIDTARQPAQSAQPAGGKRTRAGARSHEKSACRRRRWWSVHTIRLAMHVRTLCAPYAYTVSCGHYEN